MENRKGVVKRKIGRITVIDFETRNIITNALTNNGYELVSTPISIDTNGQVGEVITIYKIE